jgi:nucleoside-diphosphate-sugar epimerase
MRVLIIGGTGLISRGIVKHLLERKADIVMFNRGQRENTLPPTVKLVQGDRNDPAQLKRTLEGGRYDVVIDMICFNPDQAQAAVDVFGGQCEQFIFCSTVCTYGVKVPPNIVVDENFPQEPISPYGKNKVACEKIFDRANDAKRFAVTTIRPSHTYGPGGNMIDNLEGNSVAWDRIEKGLPVLCAGDGLGLWVSTHRDDVGKLFAYACLNLKTYGNDYNATREENFTWRDFYRQGAAAMGKKAQLLFMPAQWIIDHDPKRFGLLREITQFHGAYTSLKARKVVRKFRCDIGFEQGMRETIEDTKRRNAWKTSDNDPVYTAMVEKATALGVKPVEA